MSVTEANAVEYLQRLAPCSLGGVTAIHVIEHMRFDELLTKLNAGEGTAGQLLKDKQLYENMNGAVGDLRALIAEIKKDPKKYLNVKVSIF